MIKRINESKTFAKHILCECRYEFDGRKCNLRQNWNNNKCQCDCKRPIRHNACKEEYAWNSSTCTFERDKNCEIREYLKDWMNEKSCSCTSSFLWWDCKYTRDYKNWIHQRKRLLSSLYYFRGNHIPSAANIHYYFFFFIVVT